MVSVGNFREFAGKMFRIVRSEGSKQFPREFFNKTEVKERARQIRATGKKTRIVKSRNVKRYGGDIAYFLFKEMDEVE